MSKKKIVIKSEALRLVYAEVYSPMRVDTDEEAMTAEEIRKMAHGFLADGRTTKIDVQHNYEESGCRLVESFLARENDPDGFVEGAWVAGVHVIPDDIWKAVQKGELNGFSFAASVDDSDTRKVKVRVARRIIGSTEKSSEGIGIVPHEHEVDLAMDKGGKIVPGHTAEAHGHSHEIKQATATMETMGHSHRLIIVENAD